MELLLKVLLGVVIVIAIVGVAFFALQGVFTPQVTQAQAQSLVLSDLQNSNPGAVVNITNSTPSQFPGSWHIVVSVVTNATSPCPSYYLYSYDYPKYRFVYTVVDIYTQNCDIYESSATGTYIISSYPVAITKATTMGIPLVVDYIAAYGAQNVTTHATYYPSLTVQNATFSDAWAVEYNAAAANDSVYAVISDEGALDVAYNVSH